MSSAGIQYYDGNVPIVFTRFSVIEVTNRQTGVHSIHATDGL
jgi:hypothetical protein